jgi:hypothetical protein
MNNPEIQRKKLVKLFKQTRIAHKKTVLEGDTVDDQWPNWYANFLQERITRLTGLVITLDKLENILLAMSEQHPENTPTSLWSNYFADYFIQHINSLQEK